MAFVFKPQWQNEGVGAKVIRVIGNQHLKRLDPFLMLDYFHVKLPAGFPDHPHRGFQTITYMQNGLMHHEDFKGHKGTISPGGLQWMTAGRGILHAQMPGSYEEESIGFQLWLNLKSTEKMKEPKYQEFDKEQIPIFQRDGTKVKIICGEWQGHTGPIKYETPSYYMDITIPKNGKFAIDIPQKWNGIIYVYKGSAKYQGTKAPLNVDNLHCCVIQKSQNQKISHVVNSVQGASFMLIAGRPLNEPVANHGPFVMNTQEEIMTTFKDYQQGKNGFEGSEDWKSSIRNMAKGKKYQEL